MTGNGLSAGDVLALSKDNDGFLGDGIWGIIMLLIIAGLFSGNGFGWGNRDKGITEEYIANQFTQRDLYNNNTNILETKYALGTEILNNKYTNELGVQNIIASQKDCCCTTNRNIDSVRYDNLLNAKGLQYQLNECCCTLRAEGLANTQKILDKMCENEISQLRTDLQSAQLQISQLSQTANITNTLRPFPTPSYVVSSPYTSLYNPYNGCGCGNSTII